MTRSTLRCAAWLLLALTLLLPGMAAARETPSGRPAEPVSLARLWTALVQALPGLPVVVASDEGDSGWQLDPNGTPTPGANDDNGWQLDPNG